MSTDKKKLGRPRFGDARMATRSVSFDPGMWLEIERAARADDCTFSDVVRAAVAAWLKSRRLASPVPPRP
jgi:hypothetical protein